MQQFREMKQIMNTEQEEIELIYNYLDKVLSNQFISTSDIDGIKRYEKLINITAPTTDSLEDRRFRILARYNEQLPYTMRVLHNQLANLCGSNGYTVALNNNEYTLTIKVALTAKNNFNDVSNLLDRVVPANLVINLSLLYNKHEKLSTYTYEQLSAYTHEQLREEVLDDARNN